MKINKADVSVVLDAACKVAGLPYEVLLQTRKRPRVMVRYAAMNLIKQTTDLSLSEIGRMFNRDHSTVFHAEKVHEGREYDNVYSDAYNKLVETYKQMMYDSRFDIQQN